LFFSDLCSAYGANILGLVDVEPIAELLTQGRRSKLNKTRTLSQWATKEIRKLKNASTSW
jgi:importin subunit beta-1